MLPQGLALEEDCGCTPSSSRKDPVVQNNKQELFSEKTINPSGFVNRANQRFCKLEPIKQQIQTNSLQSTGY